MPLICEIIKSEYSITILLSFYRCYYLFQSTIIKDILVKLVSKILTISS